MEQKLENQIVIDGSNATFGRLCSFAAKQALLGKNVIIVNANEVVIVGNKINTVNKYKVLIKKGGHSLKGPKIVRTSERILKRAIRGMLDHKSGRGSAALKRIMCYNQTPEEYQSIKKIVAGKEKRGKFITLKELVSLIK